MGKEISIGARWVERDNCLTRHIIRTCQVEVRILLDQGYSFAISQVLLACGRGHGRLECGSCGQLSSNHAHIETPHRYSAYKLRNMRNRSRLHRQARRSGYPYSMRIPASLNKQAHRRDCEKAKMASEQRAPPSNT